MPSLAAAERVFHEARALPAGEMREQYVLAACGEDVALHSRVVSLLAAESAAGSFLVEATEDQQAGFAPELRPPGLQAALRERSGTSIGPYKLLQQIGEGGFGTVWMAEQTEPVVRRVALKIIKPGMDTGQVIARFEAEWHALAMMDHPNIARVLDAGETAEGRPFFVMELVRGDPITQYCDRNRLRIRKRLELFAQICAAVQHAHTKGIIHRDLKPSNMLVSTQDGQPLVKVIDFGIAKAMAARLTDKTLFTEQRQMIGTPQYMSPEQAEGSLDIDTRSDVYALGSVLYELLVGATPFDPKALQASYAEMQRIIRHVEPPRPSARLLQMGETAEPVAESRHTEPRRLRMLLRGELDWIAMKCLDKDRQRRYETANALARDIERHLVGAAVVAAPPSTAYRLRKWVSQNKAAALVALAMLAAVISLGIGFFMARRMEEKLRAHAAAVERVENFHARELEFPARLPDLQLALATSQYGQALSKFEEMLGEDHPRTLSVHFTMGSLLRLQNQPRDAEPYYRRAYEGWRKQELGLENPRTQFAAIYLAACLADEAWQMRAGDALRIEGAKKTAEAEALLTECMDSRTKQQRPSDDWILLRARLALGHVITASVACGAASQQQIARLAEAEKLLLDLDNAPLDERGVRYEAARSLERLYNLWHELEPGKGHDAAAADWKEKVAERSANLALLSPEVPETQP